jgi:carboxymethylenebutenolidase
MTEQTTASEARNAQWETVQSPDGPMRVYVARPHARPADRAILVLQEAFGVNDHIQQVARRFAARGFLALAPDLFHRTGVETLEYAQHAEAMPLIGAIGVEQIGTDVTAALGHLAAAHGVPVGRTALVGFCFGGRAAFTSATLVSHLAGTVVFYGPGIAAGPHEVLERAADLDAPILLHAGSEDPTIPAAQVAAIDEALGKAGVDYRSHLYPDAGHAFACDARPNMYRPGPADQAWQRTWAFLEERLPRTAPEA